MEHTVELIPQVGIVLDGAAVRLESSREEVEQALGSPESTRWNSFYYFDNELRIDFDEAGCAEFIELLGGPDGALQPVLWGLEVFRAPPEAVLGLLREKNGPNFVDAERGYCYTFRNLNVGLYRESVPENVQELIAEAEAGGHPLSEADIEHETRRTHWATAGLGAEYYYM